MGGLYLFVTRREEDYVGICTLYLVVFVTFNAPDIGRMSSVGRIMGTMIWTHFMFYVSCGFLRMNALS